MLCGAKVNKVWILIVFTCALLLYTVLFYDTSAVDWRKYVPSRPATPAPSTTIPDETGTVPAQEVPQSTKDVSPIHDADSVPEDPIKNTILHLPSDYLVPDKDDEWCESFYGPRYLEHIAEHHIQYCESGSSRSSLECFRTHANDELCLARGVRYDPAAPAPLKATTLDCQVRNFTLERSKSAELALELKDVKEIDDFGSYFFGTGAGPQLKKWEIAPAQAQVQGAECTANRNDGKYYLLVQREGNVNIWHNLMEIWQAMITIDALQMSVDASTGSAYLAPAAIKDIEVVLESEKTGPVWDLWGMITGKPPIIRSSLPASCLGNVILPLAGSSSPFWQAHWDAKDCKNTFILDAFLRRIYRHLDIQPKQRLTEETVVTIIDRKSSRRILNLDEKIKGLQARYPSVRFQAVDFSTISLREQILTMRGTDVLVGVIGAGMTHLMFLPRESSVAEIIPPKIGYEGFRNLAKMRGLQYYTTHGESEEEWMKHSPLPEKQQDDDALKSKGAGEVTKKVRARGWQKDEWIYLTDEEFQLLVDAAINGQLNRGLRNVDVTPQDVKGSA
ncbi:MAG: hypothetical protein M1818_005896 [Claussenomyces sp. TS43310]|nr:MAG: hypothetical protein M1818_005896 [Claussenomyces sp. TS43310]